MFNVDDSDDFSLIFHNSLPHSFGNDTISRLFSGYKMAPFATSLVFCISFIVSSEH